MGLSIGINLMQLNATYPDIYPYDYLIASALWDPRVH